jgi:hypothetical protein
MPLRTVSLDALTIDDEGSFTHVGLYQDLKAIVKRSGHRFAIPEEADAGISWDRALFLNLTFWDPRAPDILCEDHLPADVIAHIAWHHLASTRLADPADPAEAGAPAASATLFGESLASAFDLYLVGRLLEHQPDSDFINTQIPIMSEAAQEAGLSEGNFEALLTGVAKDPEAAFEELRALLLDASLALLACREALEAQKVLEGFAGRRFYPLLHHYQLSNWILYARAYATARPRTDERVAQIDRQLREAPCSLDWLAANWVNG